MPADNYQVGFLMDAYETLNLDTETSLLCMDELMHRGHRVYWIEQDEISLLNGQVSGHARRVESTAPFRLGEAEKVDINALDSLLIRKDPPFDAGYLHLTYLLDFLHPGVLQLNSPAAMRNLNEKITTLRWPEFCPETLVSSDVEALAAFTRRHERTVLKPLDNCSGRGISILDRDQSDNHATLSATVEAHGYLMAQEYLPAVSRGDKRVFLVGGQPVGWVNRVPAAEGRLANIHQGATCEQTRLTEQESAISQRVGAFLLEHGVLLAGLDFIDGRLTEVNLTSPSAVRQINEVDGTHLELLIVDAIVSCIALAKDHLNDGALAVESG